MTDQALPFGETGQPQATPEQKRATFLAVMIIFLLSALASLVAVMGKLSSGQHAGSALAVQASRAWFAARLQRALDLRERLFDAPFYRLIHAEADGLPGVIIDRFGDTAVVQPNAAWADARLEALTEALVAVTGVTNVLKSASGRARGLEGLDDVSATLAGTAPDAPVPVQMNGATYMADVTGGQKTGLFYDQRPNHAFAARLSQGAKVLDVFSHVGGFGLACLAGGAESAVAVDGSAPALALAEHEAVLKAFQRGDVPAAAQAMGAHISNARTRALSKDQT